MMDQFLTLEWMARSKIASENRKKNFDYMVYSGGSCSFGVTLDQMSEQTGHRVSVADGFLATHRDDRGKSIVVDYRGLNDEDTEMDEYSSGDSSVEEMDDECSIS